MCHITTWEEDYKGNNTSPSLQSPLANSSSPSCTYLRSQQTLHSAALTDRHFTCLMTHGVINAGAIKLKKIAGNGEF
jgi:hypothetical protein